MLPGQNGGVWDWSYCGDCVEDTKDNDVTTSSVTMQDDLSNDVILSKVLNDDEGSAIEINDDVILSDDECDDCDDDGITNLYDVITADDVTSFVFNDSKVNEPTSRPKMSDGDVNDLTHSDTFDDVSTSNTAHFDDPVTTLSYNDDVTSNNGNVTTSTSRADII